MKQVSKPIIQTLTVLSTDICAAGCIGSPTAEEKKTLLIYVGAGLKDPMVESDSAFGEKTMLSLI